MSASALPAIVLRPYQLSDADRLAVLLNDPDLTAMTSSIPYPYARSDAEAFLSRMRANEGAPDNRAIAGDDGQLLGGIGLRMRDDVEEIGYWVGRPYWGQGIATAAVRAYLALLDAHGHVGTILAQTLTNNIASQKVLLANGFSYAGEGECVTPARQTKTQPSKRYMLAR